MIAGLYLWPGTKAMPFRSYEPDYDGPYLDSRSAKLITEDMYWSAYRFAAQEGWPDEWVLDHADREDLPAELKAQIPLARQRMKEASKESA